MDSTHQRSPQDPIELGARAVHVPSPNGQRTAWLLSADEAPAWAIHLPGSPRSHAELLRTVPCYLRAGITSLILDHDGVVWEEVEDAVTYVLESDAEKVLLVGYGQGMATLEAFLEKSARAGDVAGTVHHGRGLDLSPTLVPKPRANLVFLANSRPISAMLRNLARPGAR